AFDQMVVLNFTPALCLRDQHSHEDNHATCDLGREKGLSESDPGRDHCEDRFQPEDERRIGGRRMLLSPDLQGVTEANRKGREVKKGEGKRKGREPGKV